ncbi:MAG: hypothetical protein II680_10010, partial [Clostridia bacterium]|nr:hypothetical protein [Clostridia bacterium]
NILNKKMSQREICIDRVLLYSNNLDTNLTKATNTMKSYKKVVADAKQRVRRRLLFHLINPSFPADTKL